MKNLKFNLAGFLAVLLILVGIWKAYIEAYTNIDQNLIEKIINSYLIAYIGYKISYMDTKRVGLIFLPLAIYSLGLVFFIKGVKFYALSDLSLVVIKLYPIIFYLGLCFLLELLFNKIIGSFATSIVGCLSLASYIFIETTAKASSLLAFSDFFLYFAFYVMAIRVRQASRIGPIAIVLAFLLVFLEGFILRTFTNIDYNFLLSLFPLTYLSLKLIGSDFTFVDYIIFSLIYIYPSLCVIIKSSLGLKPISIVIISVLAAYILADLIYRANNKVLSFISIGIY